MNSLSKREYEIILAASEGEMKSIIDFFLSEYSFDDRKFTPGEKEELMKSPLIALKNENFFYWYALHKTGKVIGALGVKENVHKTGGYIGDYCVIHKDFRKVGIAHEMHQVLFKHLENLNARYLLIQTCDLPDYKSIRKLLESLGFKLVGHCPNYYYQNEGMLLYMKEFIRREAI